MGYVVISTRHYQQCFCTKVSANNMKKQFQIMFLLPVYMVLSIYCVCSVSKPSVLTIPDDSIRLSLVYTFYIRRLVQFVKAIVVLTYLPKLLSVLILLSFLGLAVKLPEILYNAKIEDESLTKLQLKLMGMLKYVCFLNCIWLLILYEAFS